MNVIKTGLYIVLGAIVLSGLGIMALSKETEKYIDHIYDGDMYAGGKEDDEL